MNFFPRFFGLGVRIGFIVFFAFNSLVAGEENFSQLKEEFKKGNYSFVESKTKLSIEKSRYNPSDPRLILLYIASASDLSAMDLLMDRVYINNKSLGTEFYNSVFLLLERCLVAGKVDLVEKWGFRFRQNGKGSSKYAEGLYLYASMFYETNRTADANFVLSLAEKENPSYILLQKINRLRDFIRKSQNG